jgi:hypothetical protein
MRQNSKLIAPVDDLTRLLLPLLMALAAGLIFSMLPRLIGAQAENKGQVLEVSPPSQEVTGDPGKTIEVSTKIRNNSQITKKFNVRIDNFVASGTEGQIALTEKSPYAVSNWASLSPSTFDLPAGKSQEVTARITIPAGSAGGRYGAFVFSVVGTSSPNAAALTQEIASLFLVKVNGPVTEKLSLTSILAPFFSEFGPIKLNMVFQNSGNIHMRPRGVITYKDIFGRTAGSSVMPVTNVFPGADRQVPITWDKKFLIGYFTAIADIKSGGNSNQNLSATTKFIVFPVRLVVIVIIVVFIIYLLRQRLLKALKALMG